MNKEKLEDNQKIWPVIVAIIFSIAFAFALAEGWIGVAIALQRGAA